jgi:hypothetical protein
MKNIEIIIVNKDINDEMENNKMIIVDKDINDLIKSWIDSQLNRTLAIFLEGKHPRITNLIFSTQNTVTKNSMFPLYLEINNLQKNTLKNPIVPIELKELDDSS